MRIVQVMCTDRFAGIERYVVTLANGLAEHGCSVTVLGGSPTRMPRELSRSVEHWQPTSSVADAVFRLVHLGHIDIVHAHMTHAELAAALARPFTRSHLIVTRHFAAARGSSFAGRLAASAIRRAVEVQLAPSEYVAAQIAEPCEVIWPGTARIEDSDPATRMPVVLVMQRLVQEKDTTTALRAWKCSGLGRRGWELHIVGDGMERRSLEQLSSRLTITQSCRFLGGVEDVGKHLAQASVLLAPAPTEPFGLSVVEAMAAGVPVIAAAGGAHLETVGACPDALLFKPGDWDEAGKMLTKVAADSFWRAKYGSSLQALQRDRFAAGRQVHETLATYKRLVGVAWR
jgi:glycosyltransferase involved in cell wall biosynthesis